MGIIAEYNSKKYLNNNNLSAIFDSDSFFYALSNEKHELVKSVKYALEGNIEDQILQIIQDEKLLNYSYKRINIFSKSSNFSFVPDSEYKYDSEQVFIKNGYNAGEGATVVDIVDSAGVRIIHERSALRFSNLLGISEDKQIKHLSYAWLNLCREEGVHVFFGYDQLSILVVKDGQFHFYNQFYHAGVEDAFYFVMLAFDQLNLAAEVTPIYLDGSNAQKTELSNLLGEYVRTVSKYDGGFTNLKDSSDFLDLYAISICE